MNPLQSILGQILLEDKRVRSFLENPLALEPILKKIAWKYLFLQSKFAVLPSYEKKKRLHRSEIY